MPEFRVNFAPAFDSKEQRNGETYTSPNLGNFEQAVTVRDCLADYTLLLHKRGLMPDYSNMTTIEQWTGDMWQCADHLEDD